MTRNKLIPIIAAVSLIVLGVAVGAIGTVFLADFIKYDRYDKDDFIDQDSYQAVFLTNDQTYFGHLKNIDSDYLILSDVYYVRITEDGAGQLIKLGTLEPHGPKDEMIINKGQVLFWENMRFDSQVVKTIQSIQQK